MRTVIVMRQVGRVIATLVGLLFLAFSANELATSQWWYAGIDAVIALVAFVLAHRWKVRVERLKNRPPDPRHPVTPLPPR